MSVAVNNEAPKLNGVSLVVATTSVCLGTLLIALDIFIANVSIPTIAGELGVSQDNGSWVITSYTVANAIMVPLTGWLTSVFGRIRLFCISSILFSIMSLLCGLSVSFSMLITFRILQGAVSGSLIPLSQALLMMLYPKHKSFALALWGVVVMVGNAMGPIIGGWITYDYNWRWIFNINVPLGILAGVVTFAMLWGYESKRKRLSVDVLGIALLAVWVGSFQVVLDRGNNDDWFRSHFIVTLSILAFVFFCFFLVWELFHPDPVVDLSFFKSRNFSIGSISLAVAVMLLFSTLVVGPIWVQQSPLNYTPLWAGYSIAFLGVSSFFLFPLVGIYLHLMDIRLWVGIGFALMAPSFFYMGYLVIDTPFYNLALPRFFQGIGFAFFTVPLITLSLSGVSEKKIPSAAGIVTFVRLLGVSTGVSLGTTYYVRRENFFQSRYVEYVIASNPQMQPYYQAVKTQLGLTGKPADAFVYQMVQGQAYAQTFFEFCWLVGWGYIFLFIILFFFRSEKAARGRAKQLAQH
ncbi:MAG: DHA2 family efflux MFS transporter permease subunit [Chlamydiales bacterium]